MAEDPAFTPNTNFKTDMFNVVLGIIGQLCLIILPMYVVLWLKLPLLITVGILMISKTRCSRPGMRPYSGAIISRQMGIHPQPRCAHCIK
jgi:hypothetical protein